MKYISRLRFILVLGLAVFLVGGSATPARAFFGQGFFGAGLGGSSGGSVANLCAELLTAQTMPTAVDVVGAPGLRILSTELYGFSADYETLLRADTGAFYQHELVSSARYARMINERSGETLLMVPGIEHKSIPGFDGVVFNSKGEPVANYSVKTLIATEDVRTPARRAWRAIEQARRFSFVERWLHAFHLLMDSGHVISSKEQQRPEVIERKKWLARSLALFGVKTGKTGKRPTRVVVDIQTSVPMPTTNEVETMRGWIRDSKGLIESITVIRGDAVLEIR